MKSRALFSVGITFYLFLCSAKSVLAGTNRDDIVREIETGWEVAWGKHVDHIEYVQLAPCMLDPSTSSCVSAFFSKLLADSAVTIGKDLALQALENPDQLFGAGEFEVQGGLVSYNHWGRENPCSIWGGKCWTGKIPHPNTHQPYVRWRRRRGGFTQAELENFVTEAYQFYLGRSPESDSALKGWAGTAKDSGLDVMRNGIADSPEGIIRRNTLVDKAYSDCLGRFPSDEARSGWAGGMRGNGEAFMRTGICNSPEANEKIPYEVKQAYKDCLGRDPESNEVITSWTNSAKDVGIQGMRKLICNSPEAQSR